MLRFGLVLQTNREQFPLPKRVMVISTAGWGVRALIIADDDPDASRWWVVGRVLEIDASDLDRFDVVVE